MLFDVWGSDALIHWAGWAMVFIGLIVLNEVGRRTKLGAAIIFGVAPLAMVFKETTTKIALGCVVTHCPGVTDLDQDPTEVIHTGDWVRVDGDHGTVEILKRVEDR